MLYYCRGAIIASLHGFAITTYPPFYAIMLSQRLIFGIGETTNVQRCGSEVYRKVDGDAESRGYAQERG